MAAVRDATFELLRSHGMTTIFGNPGSTELPMLADVPAATGCCGMAGDRGWLHPELPAAAVRDLARELDGREFDVCLSSNRTCEVALQEVTGRPYASFVLAVEALTRGATARD